MAVNITHVDNAKLVGKNKAADMMNQWQQQFYQPIVEAQIAQMWQQMPDELKMAALAMNPEAAKRIDKKYGK